mgnify:CR=1 FL=1
MGKKTKFYLVAADALPEIFLKVAEAKRMLHAGEVSTAGEAARPAPSASAAAPFISTATACSLSTI